jgi:hypothetical protein
VTMMKSKHKDFILYLHAVELALTDTESNYASMSVHLNKLTTLIQRLMQQAYESQDKDDKVVLATLEKRARECLYIIRDRLAVCN